MLLLFIVIVIIILIVISIIIIAIAGAHNPEWATPILGLCHGVFTDQFIIRHVLGYFFPWKQNLQHVYERIRSIRYQKVKKMSLKGKKYPFRSAGFADWFVEFKRYSKLVVVVVIKAELHE